LRVCCTPLPILGFVEFRAGPPVLSVPGFVPSSSTLQPFEAFPLSAAVPLSRAPAFLPFAFRESGRFDFKALLHGSSPPRQKVLPPAVARCFLGLFFYET
jgi:hypothetical protein